jgi:para-nitrobenzyl esterase
MVAKTILATTFFIILAFTGCNSSSSKTDEPIVPEPDTLRSTQQGDVIGFNGLYDSHAWQGIPFANPPVGEMRWRAPQKPDSWQDTRQMLQFENHCPQLANRNGGVSHLKNGTPTGDEDCLYLNIWTPKFKPDQVPKEEKQLPVMVWIHGGSNAQGHGGLYNGGHLAVRHGMVIITVNYRLGPFGWFTHPGLRAEATNPEEASGNFGTLDLIQALEWVKVNISAFGGDPSNVTVFGESAGGFNIFAMLVSPSARGLFHKAIIQSGGTSFSTIAEAESDGQDPKQSEKVGSTEAIISLLIADQKASNKSSALTLLKDLSTAELSKYLRSKNQFDVLNAFRRVDQDGKPSTRLRVHSNLLDDIVIPNKDPAELFKDAASYNQVPVIFGTNRDEQKLYKIFDPQYVDNYFGAIFRVKNKAIYLRDVAYETDSWKLRGVDRAAAAIRESYGPRVFAYRFDWDEQPNFIITDFGEILGAAHGFEIPFVFGHFDLGSWLANLMISFNDEGRLELSESMMSYWAEFAYSGNPGRGRNKDLPGWTPWSNQEGQNKMIVFDTADDGGIRMSPKYVTFQKLVTRIESDETLSTQEEKCRMFAKMFHGRFEWDLTAYNGLAGKGCGQFDPVALKN